MSLPVLSLSKERRAGSAAPWSAAVGFSRWRKALAVGASGAKAAQAGRFFFQWRYVSPVISPLLAKQNEGRPELVEGRGGFSFSPFGIYCR
jgi:hypothetical protein